MSRASAYHYMNVAAAFADVPEVVEQLPATTVYKLAAKATPAEVRDAIVREITAGDRVSAEDVQERIFEAKAKVAEEKRVEAQRKGPKHPPAANDDAEATATALPAPGREKTASSQPLGEETCAGDRPSAKLSAEVNRPIPDTGRKDQEPADQAANDALAWLLQHLPTGALRTLEACASSEASWSALRRFLASNGGLNAAA